MSVLSEEMRRMVRKEGLCFIATVRPDGTPNLSPKGSTIDLDGNHLAFADVESPRTIRNLVENPAIEINVVDPFTRKGFRFRGSGKVLRSGAPYWAIVEQFKANGADVRGIRAVVVVEVAFAASLVAPIYSRGADEDGVVRAWTEYRDHLRTSPTDAQRPPSDI